VQITSPVAASCSGSRGTICAQLKIMVRVLPDCMRFAVDVQPHVQLCGP